MQHVSVCDCTFVHTYVAQNNSWSTENAGLLKCWISVLPMNVHTKRR